MYKLTNHLGNVLPITNKKIPVTASPNNEIIDYFTADVVTANDYYPGGMLMPGRKYQASATSNYRFSINGQEKSDELNENLTTALYWEYDSRIGRRWNVDPITLTNESPYLVNGGNPIIYTDPLGDFKSKFWAQWNKFWHGGNKVGKNKCDEWYVTKNKGVEVKENGEVVAKYAYYYGKGRDRYSTAKEKKLNEFEYEQQVARMTRDGLWNPNGKPIDVVSITAGVLLPNPILKSGTILVNARKALNFDEATFANEIVSLNKATEGGGVLLNGNPSAAINSAMYYEKASEQGAAIFRSIAHGHMFVDGNKRTAVEAFISFAKIHGLKIVSKEEMFNVAYKVAQGIVTDVSEISKMLTK